MKKFIKYTFVAFLLLSCTMSACKKDIMTYDTFDFVAFTTDSVVYPFFNKATTLTQDTVNVRIKLIGNIAERDRDVNLVIDDSTTAIAGVNYKLITPVLKKDSNFVSAKVILYRTADLKTSSKVIWFSLKDGSGLKRATYAKNALSTFKLRFSDKLEKPDWWDDAFYLYPWTEIRMRFYIDVMGSENAPDTFAPNGSGLYFTLYKLKTALLEYNATHSTPLTDANGKVSWEIDWINY